MPCGFLCPTTSLPTCVPHTLHSFARPTATTQACLHSIEPKEKVLIFTFHACKICCQHVEKHIFLNNEIAAMHTHSLFVGNWPPWVGACADVVALVSFGSGVEVLQKLVLPIFQFIKMCADVPLSGISSLLQSWSCNDTLAGQWTASPHSNFV